MCCTKYLKHAKDSIKSAIKFLSVHHSKTKVGENFENTHSFAFELVDSKETKEKS